jgi:hypothetical protein
MRLAAPAPGVQMPSFFDGFANFDGAAQSDLGFSEKPRQS